jgi:hypothetical protein
MKISPVCVYLQATPWLTQKSYYVEYQCNGFEGDGRAPNSDLCTPPSPEIDLDKDLTCWASLEEVSSSPDVANHPGDSSAKSSLHSTALQLQVPNSGDTNASSGRWRKVNEARTGCLDNVSGADETLSAITIAQQQGGSDNTLNILPLGETGVGK